MGKNKNKKKKINPKRERYAKFHKEKPSTLDVSMPDLETDLQKAVRDDQDKVDKFLRFNRNPPTKEIVERRMKAKR